MAMMQTPTAGSQAPTRATATRLTTATAATVERTGDGGDGTGVGDDGTDDSGDDGDDGSEDGSEDGTDGGTDGGEEEAGCADADVLCVDDDPGDLQEYTSIQAAVDAAQPGDTAFGQEGTYAGFRVSDSGTADQRIVIWAHSGVNLEGAEPGNTNNVVRLQAVSDVTVRGFRIVRDGNAMAYDYDYACVAARGTTVDNPMHGITIPDNEIAGCSPAGLCVSQTEGLVLSNNYIHDNVHEDQGGNGQAIDLSNAGTDNVTAGGNRLLDNDGPGIHMNGDSSIGGDGLQFGHLFEGNLIVGNGQNGFNMDGVQDSVIVNNVFALNDRYGIRGFRIDGQQGPGGMVIINNTFVQNGDTATRFTDDVGGHILFNNLVVDNTSNVFDIEESSPQLAGNVFEDEAARDYRITANSGAVDLGVETLGGQTAPADDLNGFTRMNSPDVGAFELGSDG